MRLTLTLSIALIAFTSCAALHEPTLPSGQATGEEIELQDILTFSVVDANPPAHFERTLLVEADVIAVCQKAGCWMQIEDDGKKAMVRWESGCGGKYSFPKDLAGRRVLIQGSFYPKTITEEDAQHLEEEAGRKIDIAREGYEFNASAILVLDE